MPDQDPIGFIRVDILARIKGGEPHEIGTLELPIQVVKQMGSAGSVTGAQLVVEVTEWVDRMRKAFQ